MNDKTRLERSGQPPGPLDVRRLRNECDPGLFEFATTAELGTPAGMLGQERALEAIEFGCEIAHKGFNIYVAGSSGLGMEEAVLQLLEKRAADEPAPDDWVYVNNFRTPHKPVALRLPAGRGRALADAMASAIEELRTTVPALFESEEYQNRRRSTEESVKQYQESAFAEIQKNAETKGLTILHTPAGFAIAPVRDGKVIKPEVFRVMDKAEREQIEAQIEEIQEQLADVLKSMPRWMRELRDKIRDLDREFAQHAVGQSMADLRQQFADHDAVVEYLHAVEDDLVQNIYVFLARQEDKFPGPVATAPDVRNDPRFRRYMVNVLVGNDNGGKGAPVVREDLATLANLVGRIEHLPQMGTLVTDFLLIKPGALHRANGGYLMLDVRKLLTQPFAWDALKRALSRECVRIESAAEYFSSFATVTLDPDPIPLDTKVVLFGDKYLYYLLSAYDPEFGELFKVEAEFETELKRAPRDIDRYAFAIAGIAADNGLRPLDPSGVAAVIEYASRIAEDAERLSLRTERIADLMREADYWAGKAGKETIGASDIDKADRARERRAERLRERHYEVIERDIIRIDTDGEAVGQVNGLSVLQIGDFAFGKPARVSAKVYMGTGRVIDIEREVALGGPIHSKGVLILSGFISERYAPKVPLSFAATLVFEQSYGGVEGDSASSTELYALMSALSRLPIKQSLAVTGSVDQYGNVQAIGGVNQKIEGFFAICKSRGLTGKQGVLIPASNVQHLMLKQEVVDACAEGLFHIYAVETVDQGISLLTGVPAGERGEDGLFPEGTVNRMVEDRLIALAEARRSFGGRDVVERQVSEPKPLPDEPPPPPQPPVSGPRHG